MICIVDYGLGNLTSIFNMLMKIGIGAVMSGDPGIIENASKLILPGVGAFDNGMESINELGLHEILDHKILIEKTPVLGICLGMQLMTKESEEGRQRGLGWVDAKVVKFDHQDRQFKIPHMGWNSVQKQTESPLTKGFDHTNKYYFVHSFHVTLENNDHEILSTNYGTKFTSAFAVDNIFGVQFHPEKSHKYGMALLRNFADI